jgi:hypothetical protein
LDLTEEESKPVLVIVETVSAPTSQHPPTTTTETETAETARMTTGSEPMDIGGTPTLPPIGSLFLAGEQSGGRGTEAAEGQRELPTAEAIGENAASAETALHEHDYARAEGGTAEMNGAEGPTPQPTAEPDDDAPEEAAVRERGSSGEYVDAPTGSQPVAARVNAPEERPT